MPAEFDKCVRGMMSNPDFKSKKGKSKKDSAYAICTTQYQKRHKGKNPSDASYHYPSETPYSEEWYKKSADQRFLHEAIQMMENHSMSYYEGTLQDERVISLFEDLINYHQMAVAKLALLRLELDPDAEYASDETMAELRKNDIDYNLAIILLESDKDFWDKYGND